MRTTNKQFVELVRAHVIEHLSDEETTEVSGQLQNTMNEFKSWYSSYEQKRTPNMQTAFKDFLLGLPSCLTVEFTYHNISLTLKAWFEACGEEYREKECSIESDLYYHLVVREFFKLYEKHCKVKEA